MRSVLSAWLPESRQAPYAEGGNPPTERLGHARTYPLAALLFAPASVLDPMSRNLNQATLADAVPALIGATLFALLVWTAAAAYRRRADAGAAVIASIWVFGCLYYIELLRHLNRALGGGYEMVRPLPIALVVMILLTAAAQRWGRSLRFVHTVLTGVALVMFVTPAWRVAAYEWTNGAARLAYDPDLAAAALPPPADPVAPGFDRPPDVYHFVFDRYGSERVLARHYGIEEPIGAFLEDRGFYVARDSYSNYLKTGHSLASTFAMDYLTPLAEDPRVQGSNWHPIFKMLDDHRVGRFLRDRGYEHYQYGSWWVGTYDNPVADANRPFGFSEFNMMYLRRTVVRPVFQLMPDYPFPMRLDWDNGQCQRVARKIEDIKGLGGGDRPMYVFAHFLVPHGPEVFTPDGRCLSHRASRDRGERQGYVDQIAYADAIIEDLVTTIQASGRPAAILIQADEGPFPKRDNKVPWQDAPAEELRIKTGILNAYYFPDQDYSGLRQDVTPVNSYRLLFNDLFDTDFEELPDLTYAFAKDNAIYEFHDVTRRVRCEFEVDPAGAQC